LPKLKIGSGCRFFPRLFFGVCGGRFYSCEFHPLFFLWHSREQKRLHIHRHVSSCLRANILPHLSHFFFSFFMILFYFYHGKEPILQLSTRASLSGVVFGVMVVGRFFFVP
jgi:hypothetical protein